MDPMTIALMSAVVALAGSTAFLFRCYQKAKDDHITELHARLEESGKHERVLEELRSIAKKKSGGAP